MDYLITLAADDGTAICLRESRLRLCKALMDLVDVCENNGRSIPVYTDGKTLLRIKDYLEHHWDNPFVTDRPGTGKKPDDPELPDPPFEAFNPENPPDWKMVDSKGNTWTNKKLCDYWTKPSPKRRDNITDWDKKLMDITHSEMVDFAKAARFLGHEEMYAMACKTLANYDLKVLPNTQLTAENLSAHRKFYGIVSDFTPKEEIEAMSEKKWRAYGPGDPRNV